MTAVRKAEKAGRTLEREVGAGLGDNKLIALAADERASVYLVRKTLDHAALSTLHHSHYLRHVYL